MDRQATEALVELLGFEGVYSRVIDLGLDYMYRYTLDDLANHEMKTVLQMLEEERPDDPMNKVHAREHVRDIRDVLWIDALAAVLPEEE